MRTAIAALVDGEPVRAGDVLEAAAATDPRIAESFDVQLRVSAPSAQPPQEASDESRAVMDRLLATEQEIAERRAGGSPPASAENVAAVVTKNVRKTTRGRAAADPKTWSLFEFLAHEGGLRPDQELHAIFGNRKGPFVPGFGALVRPRGRTLDDALRLAKDHGYLFDPADVMGAEGRLIIRDLLDRIAEENAGRRQYRYDEVLTTKVEDTAALERDKHDIIRLLHDELEAVMGETGKIDPAIEDRVVEIMTREGETDVLTAYERAWKIGSIMRISHVSDSNIQKRQTSRDGTFLLTPEQHRFMAKLIRDNAGRPGFPTKERAEQMAYNHELLARAIEGRARMKH
jgi:hypothetical protein